MSTTRCLIIRDTPRDAESMRAVVFTYRRVPSHNIDDDQLKANGANYVIASIHGGLPLRSLVR